MLDFPVLHPGRMFRTPAEVLTADISLEEKRGILADWASDARAVENAPALRRLDDGELIAVDDVLAALKRLKATQRPTKKSRTWWRRDDDDDPPPAPAAARRPAPRPSTGDAYAVAVAA